MSGKLTEKELNELPKNVLVSLIMGLQSSVNELQRSVDILNEQLRVMNQRQYGRSTESELSASIQLQLELGLNETEATEDPSVQEPSLEDVAPRRKRPVGKRKEDVLKATEHREVIIEKSEKELIELFGENGWKRLPDQIITKLEHIPAKFVAVTYKMAVYASKTTDEIVRAEKPQELWPNSIASASLLGGMICAKYVNAVPLYRQEKAFAENNVYISRTTMANWMIQASKLYLKPFYERLKEELIRQKLIHADETPFQVTKDGRDAGSKSYMWVYRTGKDQKEKIILYDYRATRSHEHPEKFLEGYQGVLVCDGYQAYHRLEKDHPDSFRVAGCWVHCKRRFSTLVKANGVKAMKGSLAEIALQKIGKIYHEDNKLKGLPSEERLQKRQEEIKPLVDDFFEWINENRDRVPMNSETGKGFTYALNQEHYLRTFLNDASIPLDNNAAENAIRPFTVGRKNWLMIDTPKGAEASAVLYSVVETAKANNLKIYEYVTYLLEELPKYVHDLTEEIPEHLLPWSLDIPSHIRKQ